MASNFWLFTRFLWEMLQKKKENVCMWLLGWHWEQTGPKLKLNYSYRATPYTLTFPIRRVPSSITEVTNLENETSVLSEFEQAMGPGKNFYGIDVTPAFLGWKKGIVITNFGKLSSVNPENGQCEYGEYTMLVEANESISSKLFQ